MGRRWLVPASLAAAALIATGCGSSSSTSAAAAASTLNTTKIGGANVLTNAKGFTLYWFALDTSTASKCNGQCASVWPPVKGPASPRSGVTGTLAPLTRSDGSVQATWNGHPLYTYKGDTAPGQNKGNGLTLSGGVWHEVVLTGAAPKTKSSSSSSGGGYGY